MRKLAIFAGAFSGAVFLSQYLLSSEWQIILSAIFIGVILLGLLLRDNTKRAVIIIAVGAAVGFAWNCIYTTVFFTPALELDGVTKTVTAEVEDFPASADYGMNVDVKVHIDNGPVVKAIVYFYDNSAEELKPGDVITVSAEFSRADKLFDSYSSALTSKGYYLTARSAVIEGVRATDGVPAKYIHRYIAKELKDVIAEIFPNDTVGFMQALLTGDRMIISEDDALTGSMKRTGVYHIIAVSGLHVSVLSGFVFLILGRRRSVLFAVTPILLLFMGISGFSPSVVRAVIMQMFLLIAPLFKREGDSLTSLFAALFTILAFDPFAAKSVGLQLSFAAILGIILVSQRMYSFFTRRKTDFFKRTKAGRWMFSTVVGGFSTSVGALVFTLPLTAIYFGYVPLISPLVNILILWAVSLAFCLGLAATAVGAIFLPIGTAAAWCASCPVWFIIWVVKGFSRIPFAALYLDTLPVILWFIFVYLIIFVFSVGHLKARYAIIPACAAVISLAVILIVNAEVNRTDASMSAAVIDVGQGQSIVFTGGDYTAVVDCGSTTDEDAAESVYRYLTSMGRAYVDVLVLTHFHDDHANGVVELLDYIDVLTLILPVPTFENPLEEEILEVAKSRDIEVIYVEKDIEATLGSMCLNVFAPLGSSSENERGLCVLTSENDFDFLVTGDINAATERIFAEYAEIPDVEAMVIGHHGSKYSTSDELLNAAMPETAVISVGVNSYGHPAAETISKLMSRGIQIYRTDEYGTIIINREK